MHNLSAVYPLVPCLDQA